jgi:hypothetical protein
MESIFGSKSRRPKTATAMSCSRAGAPRFECSHPLLAGFFSDTARASGLFINCHSTGRMWILRLTEPAKGLLGMHETPADHGRHESAEHWYWKNAQRIAIELETGKSDYEANVGRDLERGFDQVIVVWIGRNSRVTPAAAEVASYPGPRRRGCGARAWGGGDRRDVHSDGRQGRGETFRLSPAAIPRQIVGQFGGPTNALPETLPSAGRFLSPLDRSLSWMSPPLHAIRALHL